MENISDIVKQFSHAKNKIDTSIAERLKSSDGIQQHLDNSYSDLVNKKKEFYGYKYKDSFEPYMKLLLELRTDIKRLQSLERSIETFICTYGGRNPEDISELYFHPFKGFMNREQFLNFQALIRGSVKVR